MHSLWSADGDHHQRPEEVRWRLDAAEEDEAAAEQQQPDADDGTRAEAVREPALHRPDRAVRALHHGVTAGEHRAAPAEAGGVVPENGHVGAVGLHEEGAHHGVDDDARADDPPAVEEAAGVQNRWEARSRRRKGNGEPPRARAVGPRAAAPMVAARRARGIRSGPESPYLAHSGALSSSESVMREN